MRKLFLFLYLITLSDKYVITLSDKYVHNVPQKYTVSKHLFDIFGYAETSPQNLFSLIKRIPRSSTPGLYYFFLFGVWKDDSEGITRKIFNGRRD